MYACTFSAKMILCSSKSTSVPLLDGMILHTQELRTEYNKLANIMLCEPSSIIPEQTETVIGRQWKQFDPKYCPAIPICSGSNSHALYPLQGCQIYMRAVKVHPVLNEDVGINKIMENLVMVTHPHVDIYLKVISLTFFALLNLIHRTEQVDISGTRY